MLDVINALENISIDAQLMCEVASNKCKVLSNQGLNEQTIRMLTTQNGVYADTLSTTIHSLFIVGPRKMERQNKQMQKRCC